MECGKNYKNICLLNYEDEDLVKYVNILTDKIPVYDLENKKINFVKKNEIKKVVEELRKKGKLIELKKTLEALKKDFWSEFEDNLYRIVPVSMRINYPDWIKLVYIAAKKNSSVSSVIRGFLLDELEAWLSTIKENKDINIKAIEIINKRIKEVREIKERSIYKIPDLIEYGCYIPEFLKEDKTAEAVESFVWHLIRKTFISKGVSEKIIDVLMEWITIWPEFGPALELKKDDFYLKMLIYNLIYPKGIFRKENIIREDTEHYRKFVLEFPLVLLEKASPKEILHFVQISKFPLLSNLSEEEILKLQNEVKTLDKNEIETQVIREVYKKMSINPVIVDSTMYYSDESLIDDPSYLFIDWVLNYGVIQDSILLDVEIPGKMILSGKLKDVESFEEYILDIYKQRSDLASTEEIDLKELSNSEIEELLKKVDNEIARVGMEALSRGLAKEIYENFAHSVVFTTTLPKTLTDILRLITGKSPKEIVTENIQRM